MLIFREDDAKMKLAVFGSYGFVKRRDSVFLEGAESQYEQSIVKGQVWPDPVFFGAWLPRWTCLDRRASSQSNIRGFAGRAAASDRRGSPPRALYVAGVASQFVATAGGVTFGLKSLPAGVPREQRPRE